MVSRKDENIKSSQEKLDEILSYIKELRYHIGNLDHRISQLEGHIDQKLSTVTKSVIFQSSADDEQKTDFDDLDEHLKRTYQTLATAQEPLTASQLAERMGRSRSTTSYHLNKLEKMGVLEKFPSPLKQSSRSILFRPKDRSFELIDSEH